MATSSSVTTPSMPKFNTIRLCKDKSIGIGSYGAVCKAKCDDLWCAAKIIHPTLIDPAAEAHVERRREHRMPIRRFEQECEFLSTLRHPNIVQFLGLWQEPESGLPVLLMELMDQSLTHYLENSPQQLPFHAQVDICHDIAQALSFLHNNNIIHRDLSGNNVLLIGCVRAKVTDFGMARLADLNPQASRYTFTMCPGTDAYMPPEAVKENPVYSRYIDCFSFGVLVVQILTRQFPKPGERLKEVEINHPDIPIGGTLMLAVPEVERRQNHISEIDPNHVLKPLLLDCLKDKGAERPSSQQLCERLLILKEATEYCQSKTNAAAGVSEQSGSLVEKEEEIMELHARLDSLQEEQTRKTAELEEQQSITQHLLEQLDREKHEMRSLSENFQSEVERYKRNVTLLEEQQEQHVLQIEDLEKQLGSQKQVHLDEMQFQKDNFQSQLDTVNKELELTNKIRDEFGRRIHDLEVQLQHEENKPHHRTTKLDLKWKSEKDAPIRMRRFCDAVVDGNKFYCRPSDTRILYLYHDKVWHQLPKCLSEDCALVVIQSKMTTIGGHLDLQPAKYKHCLSHPYVLDSTTDDVMIPCGYLNQLHSLVPSSVLDYEYWEWDAYFPPMPTERSNAAAVCVGNNLIVAGGEGRRERVLDTVEVMNITNCQWFTATSLPEPLWCSSATVIGGQLYMLGGKNRNWNPTQHVYTTPYIRLSSQEATLDVVWEKIADLPATNSTCISLCDQLLAVGGCIGSNPITSVHQYEFETNSWKEISHMEHAKCNCFAAVLAGNQLVVVGGDIYDSASDLPLLTSTERAMLQVEVANI